MPFSWRVQHWFHSRYTCVTNLELVEGDFWQETKITRNPASPGKDGIFFFFKQNLSLVHKNHHTYRWDDLTNALRIRARKKITSHWQNVTSSLLLVSGDGRGSSTVANTNVTLHKAPVERGHLVHTVEERPTLIFLGEKRGDKSLLLTSYVSPN